MRVIAHNMLKCNVKGVSSGYPLKIEASSVEEVESEQEFTPEATKKMLKRLDVQGLVSAAKDLGVEGLDFESEDESMLEKIHHFLFDLSVNDGMLICPESGREFVIKDGIPNMLLHEDEC
jgi:multifunctional methyltransferase subunit TRM112